MRVAFVRAAACSASLSLLLSGCVTVTSKSASKSSTKQLCQSIAGARVGNSTPASATLALSELSDRGAFSTREIEAIAAGNVYPGMSEEAGLCATGYFWYDVNTTVTASGTSKQYVLGDGNYNPRTYLYVENGMVTAYQR